MPLLAATLLVALAVLPGVRCTAQEKHPATTTTATTAATASTRPAAESSALATPTAAAGMDVIVKRFRFDDAQLEDALNHIAKEADLRLLVRWDALVEANVTRGKPCRHAADRGGVGSPPTSDVGGAERIGQPQRPLHAGRGGPRRRNRAGHHSGRLVEELRVARTYDIADMLPARAERDREKLLEEMATLVRETMGPTPGLHRRRGRPKPHSLRRHVAAHHAHGRHAPADPPSARRDAASA